MRSGFVDEADGSSQEVEADDISALQASTAVVDEVDGSSLEAEADDNSVTQASIFTRLSAAQSSSGKCASAAFTQVGTSNGSAGCSGGCPSGGRGLFDM